VRESGGGEPFPVASAHSVSVWHESGRRRVSVRCPYCGEFHLHSWPLDKNCVGLVKAPCCSANRYVVHVDPELVS
jgi:hypothetical protein